MAEPGTPQTPEEWQWAVDMGRALSFIENAKAHGLITNAPDRIRLDRIAQLTQQAAAMGIHPHDDEYCIDLYLSEQNVPPRLAAAHAAQQRGRYGS